jgi:hypothetical protein
MPTIQVHHADHELRKVTQGLFVPQTVIDQRHDHEATIDEGHHQAHTLLNVHAGKTVERFNKQDRSWGYFTRREHLHYYSKLAAFGVLSRKR